VSARRTLLGSLVLAALAWSTLAGAAVVTRGPFLQVGTTQSVVVRWRTDVPTDSRVRYGFVPGLLPLAAAVEDSSTEHEVKLTGLTPGMRVYYAVGSKSGDLAGPDADTWYDVPTTLLAPFRVWILGDSGQSGPKQSRVRDAYYAYTGSVKTDVWLMLGDNAYETGTDAEFQTQLFDPYASFLRSHVLWPTRGNHEVLRTGLDYYDLFTLPVDGDAGGLPSGTEAWYSFDHGDAHFVCLDSEGSSRLPGGAMLTWLDADLASTDKRWTIAFWHHPPYSKGTHDSDTDTRMTQMRQYALPILEAHGVDLVLTGHSHNYERSFLVDGHYGLSTTLQPSMIRDGGDGRPDGDGPYLKPPGNAPHAGAVYTVMGVSSSTATAPLDHPIMVKSLTALGSIVLDVSPDRIEGRFLDDLGAVEDSFRIQKYAVIDTGGLTGSGLALTRTGAQPSSGGAAFSYRLPSAGRVRLDMIDAKGRRVRRLLDAQAPAGAGAAAWDRNDDAGRRVAPGVYFAKLEFDGSRRVVRVVLVD
jgi:hypothetical protein